MRTGTLLTLGLLGLAACSSRQDRGNDDLDFDATDWTATLASRAGTRVVGSASARSAGIEGGPGTASSSVSISGAAAGARHPWHVHSGTCATGGPIVGDANAYPVLEVGADGTAHENAAVDVVMSESQRYHVNVHRSPSDLGTIIACGDLVD